MIAVVNQATPLIGAVSEARSVEPVARGHIAKMCQSKKPTHYVGREGDSQDGDAPEGDASGGDSDAEFLFNIKTLNTCKAGIMLELTIERKPLSMELDTGAAMTIVSERTWMASSRSYPCVSPQ